MSHYLNCGSCVLDPGPWAEAGWPLGWEWSLSLSAFIPITQNRLLKDHLNIQRVEFQTIGTELKILINFSNDSALLKWR